MDKSVYVLWQDTTHSGRMWHPVAKITHTQDGEFLLRYTKGSKNERFQTFPNMMDRDKSYSSKQLFSFLKTRIPPASRPEHKALFEWCNLSTDSDYLELLGIFGGAKVTDSYRIINVPTNKNGYYENEFFVSGIRYLSSEQKEMIHQLKPNDELYFEFESKNINDNKAVLLFETTEKLNVGYYPKYLANDLHKLHSLCASPKIKVIQVNTEAPDQYRLLCKTLAKWPKFFKTCNQEEFSLYEN